MTSLLDGRLLVYDDPRIMLVWVFVALCLLIAAYLYLGRREQVRLQSLVVGGTMGMGCVIAEALVFALLAVIAVVGWLSGAIAG